MSSLPSTPNPFTILLEFYIFYESITKIVEFNILENSFGMNNPVVYVVTIVSLPENKQIVVLFVRWLNVSLPKGAAHKTESTHKN